MASLVSVGQITITDVNDGSSNFTAFIYLQQLGQPSDPSGGSYNFTTNTLTVPSGGWSASMPTASTTPIWISTYLFSTTVTGSTVTGGTWSVPKLFSRNGTDANTITTIGINYDAQLAGLSGQKITIKGIDYTVANTGHSLVIFRPSTGAVISGPTLYGTYADGTVTGASTPINNLVNALNGMTTGDIAIISTADACSCPQILRNALLNFGSSIAKTWIPSRVSHVFIGQKGGLAGSAYEQTATGAGKDAIITATAIFTTSGLDQNISNTSNNIPIDLYQQATSTPALPTKTAYDVITNVLYGATGTNTLAPSWSNTLPTTLGVTTSTSASSSPAGVGTTVVNGTDTTVYHYGLGLTHTANEIHTTSLYVKDNTNTAGTFSITFGSADSTSGISASFTIAAGTTNGTITTTTPNFTCAAVAGYAGWYRITCTYVPVIVNTTMVWSVPTARSFDVSGFMIEPGASATTYITSTNTLGSWTRTLPSTILKPTYSSTCYFKSNPNNKTIVDASWTTAYISQGTRSNFKTATTVGSAAWSDATANTAIIAITGSGGGMVVDDEVTLCYPTVATPSFIYTKKVTAVGTPPTTATWSDTGQVIDGNLLVTGTLSAAALKTSTLNATTAITIGTSSDGINISGTTNNITVKNSSLNRVKIGNLDTDYGIEGFANKTGTNLSLGYILQDNVYQIVTRSASEFNFVPYGASSNADGITFTATADGPVGTNTALLSHTYLTGQTLHANTRVDIISLGNTTKTQLTTMGFVTSTAAATLTYSMYYVIVELGTTTNWNTMFNTTGITYTQGGIYFNNSTADKVFVGNGVFIKKSGLYPTVTSTVLGTISLNSSEVVSSKMLTGYSYTIQRTSTYSTTVLTTVGAPNTNPGTIFTATGSLDPSLNYNAGSGNGYDGFVNLIQARSFQLNSNGLSVYQTSQSLRRGGGNYTLPVLAEGKVLLTSTVAGQLTATIPIIAEVKSWPKVGAYRLYAQICGYYISSVGTASDAFSVSIAATGYFDGVLNVQQLAATPVVSGQSTDTVNLPLASIATFSLIDSASFTGKVVNLILKSRVAQPADGQTTFRYVVWVMDDGNDYLSNAFYNPERW